MLRRSASGPIVISQTPLNSAMRLSSRVAPGGPLTLRVALASINLGLIRLGCSHLLGGVRGVLKVAGDRRWPGKAAEGPARAEALHLTVDVERVVAPARVMPDAGWRVADDDLAAVAPRPHLQRGPPVAVLVVRAATAQQSAPRRARDHPVAGVAG